MSFAVGIYDLFSYTLPGVVYLVLLVETFRLITNLPLPFDPSNLVHILLAAILSFLLGIVINPISRSLWHLLFSYKRKSREEITLEYIKERHPEADIRIKPNQWPVLVAHIRRDNVELANMIDRSKAYSIMLRNFSFGMFLLAVTQAIQFFSNGYSVIPGAFAILLILFAFTSGRESLLFDGWYYSSIFEHAVAGQLPISDLVKLKSKKAPIKKKGG